MGSLKLYTIMQDAGTPPATSTSERAGPESPTQFPRARDSSGSGRRLWAFSVLAGPHRGSSEEREDLGPGARSTCSTVCRRHSATPSRPLQSLLSAHVVPVNNKIKIGRLQLCQLQ